MVPGIKGFDEDSIASHSTTHDDIQDSHVTNGVTNLSHPFHAGGYMLAASYWPKVSTPLGTTYVAVYGLRNSIIAVVGSKSRFHVTLQDRVMINRLDSICQAVLKGKWPGSQRSYEGSAAVSSFYTTKLMDSAANLADDPAASPQGSKVKKHDADRKKEFSVKINDVCSFKFSHPPPQPPFS